MTREELSAAYHKVMRDQGEDVMPTIAEQWIEEGKKQGIATSISDLLRLRFDAFPPRITEKLAEIEEPETLSLIFRQAATADSLPTFEAYLDSLL